MTWNPLRCTARSVPVRTTKLGTGPTAITSGFEEHHVQRVMLVRFELMFALDVYADSRAKQQTAVVMAWAAHADVPPKP